MSSHETLPAHDADSDEATTRELDRMLWAAPPTGFVPHCRMDSRLAPVTPVWIDHRLEHAGPSTMLVNLTADPPPFFSRHVR